MTTPTKAYFDVDLARDVRVVEAHAARIIPYIYQDELYGAVPGNFPKLTIGGLLMRFHRLDALGDTLSEAQRSAALAAYAVFESARQEWAVHYEKKILHELGARLRALAQFAAEAEERRLGARENYPAAMEKRVMIDLLQAEATRLAIWPADYNGQLLNSDNRIRRIAEKHDGFIWSLAVEAAYPQDRFWYLYLLPPIKTK
jgi:hypothetical protein